MLGEAVVMATEPIVGVLFSDDVVLAVAIVTSAVHATLSSWYNQ